MKQNLILLAVAVLLGTGTYLYQELGDRERFKKEQEEGVVLNPKELGELQAIGLPKVRLTKQGDKYLLPDTSELADERKVNWFLKILQGIKVKRIIPDENWDNTKRGEFFPHNDEIMEFVFSRGKVSFLLGKKLDFDRTFYMEVNTGKGKKRVIAFDSGPLETVYDKENSHRADHFYRRFQSLFYLDTDFFRDYRIFRHWMDKKWSLLEVEVDNRRNRKFAVNFPQASTIPSVPFFLDINKVYFKAYEKELVELEGKEFADERDLNFEKEPLSRLVVNSTQGEARLELLRSKRDKKKYFLKSSLDDRIYVLKDEETQVFLSNIQNFWNLKLFKSRPKSISIEFGNKKRNVTFEVLDGRFQVTSTSAEAGEPKHLAFKKLLDFLSQKAEYWVAGPSLEEAYIKQFTLNWGEGPFFLMIRTGEILLYHKESKQGLVFPIEGRPPIPLVKEQYFL